MASNISINLDTSKENYLIAKCKQNDDLLLEASIFENGSPLGLTNKTITIQALKADNTYIVQSSGITKESNKITSELVRDFTRVAGTTKIELVLTESGKQNTTFSFYLEVVRSVIEATVESSYTVTILEELSNKVLEAKQVKEDTQTLIQNGGAATTGDIALVNSSLEQKAQQSDLNTTNEIISNLSLTKANKNEVFTMANMGQDVRQAITGGGVAVVGENSVLTETIVDEQLTTVKTNFIKPYGYNLYNEITATLDMSINTSTGTVTTQNINVKTSDFIRVKPNYSYTINYGTSRPVAFYDSNKTFIGYVTTTLVDGKFEFVTPSNCYFIRWTLTKSVTNAILCETSLYTGNYYPYKKSSVAIENLQLEDNFVNPIKTTFIKDNKNLFDISKVESDVIITGASGTTSALVGYSTSDYIPVKKDVKVAISTRFRKLLAYTKSKLAITTSYVDANTTNYIFTPTVDGYIRISVYSNQLNEIQVEYSDVVTEYQKCGLETNKPLFLFDGSVSETALSEEVKIKINSTNISKLVGKKIMCFGDSICQGNGNGYIAYGELLKDKYSMTLWNYGIAGSTIGENANNNFITSQIPTAISSGNIPDYILVEGGTNDIASGANIEVGTLVTDYSESSFNKATTIGALEWIFYKLKTNFPNSKIAFVSVHKMGSRGLDSQTTRQNACMEVCKKWSIPVVDIFNKGNMNTFLSSFYKYSCPTETQPNGDKTHPNTLGYNTFYLPLIEETLNNI